MEVKSMFVSDDLLTMPSPFFRGYSVWAAYSAAYGLHDGLRSVNEGLGEYSVHLLDACPRWIGEVQDWQIDELLASLREGFAQPATVITWKQGWGETPALLERFGIAEPSQFCLRYGDWCSLGQSPQPLRLVNAQSMPKTVRYSDFWRVTTPEELPPGLAHYCIFKQKAPLLRLESIGFSAFRDLVNQIRGLQEDPGMTEGSVLYYQKPGSSGYVTLHYFTVKPGEAVSTIL